MCGVVILAFASILLNGTFFNPRMVATSEPSSAAVVNTLFDDIALGESDLRRIDGRISWVSYLSANQISRLNQFTSTQVKIGTGCVVSQAHCVLDAETGRTGINIQYSVNAPPQLPSDLPWLGGFVNPLNGVVYDLLGRPYLFQGEPEPLQVIHVQ